MQVLQLLAGYDSKPCEARTCEVATLAKSVAESVAECCKCCRIIPLMRCVMTDTTPPKRFATAADLVSAKDQAVAERLRQAAESAYRLGVQHGLVLAGDLLEESLSLKQARRLLTRAENMAGEYRSLSRHPGSPPILDELRRRVLRTRKPKARV